MPDTKLVNLPAAGAPDGTELYYCVQAGADKKITGSQFVIPAGATTNVQFNNAGAFGGDSGFNYLGSNNSVLVNTTSNTFLSPTPQFIVAFDPSARDGAAVIGFANTSDEPILNIGKSRGTNPNGVTAVLSTDAIGGLYFRGTDGTGWDYVAAIRCLVDDTVSAGVIPGALSFRTADKPGGTGGLVTRFFINCRAQVRVANGTSPSTFEVYNTVGSGTIQNPSDYERGIFDWQAHTNALTIGTQAGGAGTQRNVRLVGPQIQCYSDTTFASLTRVVLHEISFDFIGYIDCAQTTSPGAVFTFSGNNGNVSDGAYLNWGGQARVSGIDFSSGANNTILANVTGLTVAVAAGRTYTFQTELYVTDAAAGGAKAAIAGTCTATTIQYTGYMIADNAIKAKTNAAALATEVASSTTTETSGIIIRITGTITVANAGTLTVQFAQNTNNGTASLAKIGSWLIVHDMP
jgi:hypothetical protein